MQKIDDLVTVVIVNFKTKRLTKVAVETFSAVYKNVRIILVDNGSNDDSTEWIKLLSGNITPVLLPTNIGHGPAMDLAIKDYVSTKYVFTLDSDCEVFRYGFLARMKYRLEKSQNGYAIGWKRWVNENGVATTKTKDIPPGLRPYIHPSAAMYNIEIYKSLPPFLHHGAPAIENMRTSHERGYELFDFPVSQYIKHKVAGTRSMYGGRWQIKEGETPDKSKKATEKRYAI